MIHVDSLNKQMGTTLAVQGISFQAPDGAITGVIGTNGAGKTTTLRMIAGVLAPDAGRVRVGGVDPNQDAANARRLIGALLDRASLYGRLTAREHLYFTGRLRRIPSEELHQRARAVLDQLGLARIADRRTAGFSQGEALKVALGCALLHRPAHLLLDEPTNGLDPCAVLEFRYLLKRLREEGVCIILSSHVLGEVEQLCDRIVILANGKAIHQGTPAELCEIANAESLEHAFFKLTQSRE